jgi:hypothetical protein
MKNMVPGLSDIDDNKMKGENVGINLVINITTIVMSLLDVRRCEAIKR